MPPPPSASPACPTVLDLPADVVVHCVFPCLKAVELVEFSDVCMQWRQAAQTSCRHRTPSLNLLEDGQQALAMRVLRRFAHFKELLFALRSPSQWARFSEALLSSTLASHVTEMHLQLPLSELPDQAAARMRFKGLSSPPQQQQDRFVPHGDSTANPSSPSSPSLVLETSPYSVDHHALCRMLSSGRLASLQQIDVPIMSLHLLRTLLQNCPTIRTIVCRSARSHSRALDGPGVVLTDPHSSLTNACTNELKRFQVITRWLNQEMASRNVVLHWTTDAVSLVQLCIALCDQDPLQLHTLCMRQDNHVTHDTLATMFRAASWSLRPRSLSISVPTTSRPLPASIHPTFTRLLAVPSLTALTVHGWSVLDVPLLTRHETVKLSELCVHFGGKNTYNGVQQAEDTLAQLAPIVASHSSSLNRLLLGHVWASLSGVEAFLHTLPNLKLSEGCRNRMAECIGEDTRLVESMELEQY